jgi:taurine dioxygenase
MIRVEQQAGSLGAFVGGVDLAKPLGNAELAALRRAFLEQHVICFRDQELAPAQHLAFAARWGEIFVHPYVPSIEGYPGIMQVYDPHPITVTWHSDTTHSRTPPRMSILVARKVPPFGGDTMFANQHAAFERLSPALQRVLEGLRAVHQGTEMAREGGLTQREVTAVHPVVRTHPETGRKALFVNADYTRHFEGMTEAESRPLLEFLYAHACRPEFTWRHHWRVGDVLMWDNASVQHAVVPDVGKGERILHRVTLCGDVPH